VAFVGCSCQLDLLPRKLLIYNRVIQYLAPEKETEGIETGHILVIITEAFEVFVFLLDRKVGDRHLECSSTITMD